MNSSYSYSGVSRYSYSYSMNRIFESTRGSALEWTGVAEDAIEYEYRDAEYEHEVGVQEQRDAARHAGYNRSKTVPRRSPRSPRRLARAGLCLVLGVMFGQSVSAGWLVLDPRDYRHYVDRFNRMDDEPVVNFVPNARSWDWMRSNIPLFDCPATRLEEVYYFRWWTYRKHIRQTDGGLVLTEFLTPVSHAGTDNTISCAVGHHIAEGRWLRDQRLLDDYVRFWYRCGDPGGPAAHFHKFSSWVAAALYERYLVTGDREFLVDLLDDLVADYQVWERERGDSGGLFWQYDVKDGMEESISGGRHVRNRRPTINSYMAANALAISRIARLAGRDELATEFGQKADHIQTAMCDSFGMPKPSSSRCNSKTVDFRTLAKRSASCPGCSNWRDRNMVWPGGRSRTRRGSWRRAG